MCVCVIFLEKKKKQNNISWISFGWHLFEMLSLFLWKINFILKRGENPTKEKQQFDGWVDAKLINLRKVETFDEERKFIFSYLLLFFVMNWESGGVYAACMPMLLLSVVGVNCNGAEVMNPCPFANHIEHTSLDTRKLLFWKDETRWLSFVCYCFEWNKLLIDYF